MTNINNFILKESLFNNSHFLVCSFKTSAANSELLCLVDFISFVRSLTLLTVNCKLSSYLIRLLLYPLVLLINCKLIHQEFNKVMSLIFYFFNYLWKILIKLDDLLICCNDSFELFVIKIFVVSVSYDKDWQYGLNKLFPEIVS